MVWLLEFTVKDRGDASENKLGLHFMIPPEVLAERRDVKRRGPCNGSAASGAMIRRT